MKSLGCVFIALLLVTATEPAKSNPTCVAEMGKSSENPKIRLISFDQLGLAAVSSEIENEFNIVVSSEHLNAEPILEAIANQFATPSYASRFRVGTPVQRDGFPIRNLQSGLLATSIIDHSLILDIGT
ncbi:MAG: hypothetical protein AAF202_05810, partial [Pseudomonadota bacterium]